MKSLRYDSATTVFREKPPPRTTGAVARSLLAGCTLDALAGYAATGDSASAEALAVWYGLGALGVGLRAIGRGATCC